MTRCRKMMGDKGFLVLRVPGFNDAAEFEVEGLIGPEPHQYGKGMWVLLYVPDPLNSDQ